MTGSEYMRKVKECNCVICFHRLGLKQSPCDAHHIGTGEDHDDFATVALCKEHHQGATGVHGMHRRAFYSLWKTSDIQLLAWTNKAIHAIR
jgi:hypothetical protein